MNAKQNRTRRMRYLTVACGVLAVTGVGAAWCQQASPLLPSFVPPTVTAPAKPQPALPWSIAAPLVSPLFPGAGRTPRASAAAEQEEPTRPGSEGISVHGHWVIDVKNPDGTIAEHRDFENSLVDFGNALVGLLAGSYVAGDFAITLLPVTGPSICSSSACSIVQSTSTLYGANLCASLACNPGLTQTVTLGGFVPYPFSLSGQFVATQTGSVGSLFTGLGLCGARSSVATTVIPSACSAQTYAGLPTNSVENFTGTTIPKLSVNAGQIVQITVTLTFS